MWDPDKIGDIGKLEKVQRSAARCVKNDYGHTSSVTKMMNFLVGLTRNLIALPATNAVFIQCLQLYYTGTNYRYSYTSRLSNQSKTIQISIHNSKDSRLQEFIHIFLEPLLIGITMILE